MPHRRSQAPVPIRFGTSGWRGVIGEELTLARARALVRAVAAWLRTTRSHPSVVLGHDTRVGGPRLTAMAAAELEAAEVGVTVARGATPTPVMAHALRRMGSDAALVFTASHNPSAYQGLKVFGGWGGSIEPRDSRAIERMARRFLVRPPPPAPAPPGIRRHDLVSDYLRELSRRIDTDAIRRRRPRLVYDAMHGTGVGVVDRWLEGAGARVLAVRSWPDPCFGAGAPDPVSGRLAPLIAAVRRRADASGVATDGDGDRFTLVGPSGRVFSATELLALLVDHLAATGRLRRGVAMSAATGSLVARVAESHGLGVERHPIGFKYLSRSLAEGRTDVAGEESGGFAWEPACLDKDGVLAIGLLAEALALRGTDADGLMADLASRFGRSHCGRSAVAATPRRRRRLAELVSHPPGSIDRVEVEDVDRTDGIRLALSGGFLMWRGSGTEPLIRIYAEAATGRGLARRLGRGRAILDAGGPDG